MIMRFVRLLHFLPEHCRELSLTEVVPRNYLQLNARFRQATSLHARHRCRVQRVACERRLKPRCWRSGALMIFDWPEVTSRHASQLALILDAASPSTSYSSLLYARSSCAPSSFSSSSSSSSSFLHSHTRRQALRNCPSCR